MTEPYSNFVLLQTFSYLPDAHILKGALAAEGIESVILGENSIDLIPVNNSLLGGVRLMVHHDNYEKAKQIMEAGEASGDTETEEDEE